MPKRVPLRMCVVCREMLPKNELTRIVKNENALHLDPTGKINGRGAYICAKPECMAKCVKKHLLDKSFGEKLSDEAYLALKNEYDEIARKDM